MPFDEATHPRGEAGSAQGGQFVAAQQSSTASAAGAKPKKSGGKGLAYDPKKGTGPGYGTKNGDPRVRKMQELLTKLGLKDASGKPLVIDGKLGPRTTEAIKAAQRKYGMRPDGALTPALARRLAKPRMSKQQLARTRQPIKKTPERSAPSRKPMPPTTRRRPSSPRDSAPDSVSGR
jgi:peptidoglycan hydrolase-like protein with peptidoglycan-binding domain